MGLLRLEGKLVPRGAMLGQDYRAMVFGVWFGSLAEGRFRLKISLLDERFLICMRGSIGRGC